MRALCVLAIAAIAVSGLQAQAGDLEKKDVHIAVGGKAIYIPLIIAEQKKYFEAEGLNVTISDFKGGSQSLQALVGGSVDVAVGGYDQMLRVNAQGRNLVGFVELTRAPGGVIGVRKELGAKVNGVADLKGLKIGITSPGSTSQLLAVYALGQVGIKPDDVSFIGVGVGSSAVASFQQGEIDAVSNFDPLITTLEQKFGMKILVDTRTKKGTEALFGSGYTQAVVYTNGTFVRSNPNVTQALANAFHRALSWMKQSSSEQIADAIPAELHVGDRGLMIRALAAGIEMWSPTGNPSEGDLRATTKLLAFDKALDLSKVSPKTSFDHRFALQAAAANK